VCVAEWVRQFDGTTYGCANDEERQIWINHIHRLLRALRSKAQKRMTMQMSPRSLLAASPSTRAAAVSSASLSSGAAARTKKSNKHRWSGTMSAAAVGSAATTVDAESPLLRPLPEQSPKPQRSSVSGFSLGSRKQRAVSSSDTETESVHTTTNPLLAMKHRQRSHSNLTKAAEEMSQPTFSPVSPVAVRPPVASPLILPPPPLVVEGAPQISPPSTLPPPPANLPPPAALPPPSLKTCGSDIRRQEETPAEVLYDFK
jgi:hypothetical protein